MIPIQEQIHPVPGRRSGAIDQCYILQQYFPALRGNRTNSHARQYHKNQKSVLHLFRFSSGMITAVISPPAKFAVLQIRSFQKIKYIKPGIGKIVSDITVFADRICQKISIRAR
jgi:hypothetical protein